ncbi:MAG: ribosome-associated translation inhibitor RaiA [Clostridia bacterium]|nr:ribosome-associated translation inhibitor RaiA [Clostridia bacterium]
MKITIVGRKLNVYEDTRELIERKLQKLDKYFRSEATEALVTLSRKRNVSSLEVTINAGGTLFRSEVDADDFRIALDQTVDHIEGQIRKNKTKLAKRLRENIMDMSMIPDPEDEAPEDEPIIRVKQFEFKPMTPEEAIMQMNLLGHSFYVFNDVTTGDTCVVYTRKDGDYGLIEPMK